MDAVNLPFLPAPLFEVEDDVVHINDSDEEKDEKGNDIIDLTGDDDDENDEDENDEDKDENEDEKEQKHESNQQQQNKNTRKEEEKEKK